jgi:hypothetical protein
MNVTRYLVATALAAVLCACGSSDPKTLVADGQRDLNTNKPELALKSFNKAVEGLKPEDPLYFEARMGVVESLATIEPKRSAEEFLVLAKTFPEQIGQKQFIQLSGRMINARKYLEAIDLVHSGILRYGAEAQKLHEMIARIKKEAAKDKDVNDKLAGLGYTN